MSDIAVTPHTFRARDGSEWKVELTVGSLKRAKSEAGIDLGKALGGGFAELLFAEPETFASLLYVLCDPGKRNVSPEQFAELLDGDTIERAAGATAAAVASFFRMPRTAGAIQTHLSTARNAMDTATAEAIREAAISKRSAGDSLDTSGSTPSG